MDKIFYAGTLSKRDEDKRTVEGYATTESRDSAGETIKLSAVSAALDQFMRFPALRIMHQPVAVGSITKAVIDKKGLFVVAKVVDDTAWKLVKEKVYRGFSVGGKVTGRDPADSKVITALVLNEISLCDVSCNTEATLVFKAAGVRTVESAGSVRSIDAMWHDLHEATMIVDAMDDADPRKHEVREEIRRASEKTLSHQFKLREDARLKLKYPDPVRHLG